MGNAHSNQQPANRRNQQPSVPQKPLKPLTDSPNPRTVRTPSLILPDFGGAAQPTIPPKSASIPIKRRGDPQEKYYVQTSAHIPQEYHDRAAAYDPSLQADDSPASSYRPPFAPPTPAESSDSLTLPPPPPRGSPQQSDFFQPCTVLSQLSPPIRIKKQVAKPVPVTISWKWGGNRVILARAGDEDWKGRQVMLRSSPNSDTHSLTISLLPGTHHLRFLVDDQWRVADDLPTAVDDQGSLANYVAVGVDGLVIDELGTHAAVPAEEGVIRRIPLPPPEPSTSHTTKQPLKSFWSSTSTYPGCEPEKSYSRINDDVWTNVIPEYLRENVYVREMEAHLNHALNGTSDRNGPHRINGFVPVPRVPDVPSLPQHLKQPLLNKKTHPKKTSKAGAETVVGAVGGARGERRKKDKERDRDRERRNYQAKSIPTPPPSTSNSANNTAHSSPTFPPAPSPHPFAQLNLSTPGIDDTVSADDTSVLPVPSHVVLHHLSTVALNDVLAMSSTVRYRGKYLTTVYYKPQDSLSTSSLSSHSTQQS